LPIPLQPAGPIGDLAQYLRTLPLPVRVT